MERTLATWRKRQKEWYRINKGENKDKWVEREVLHDYTGTLKELWDEIQAGYKDYLLHRWVVDWTSWAFKLEIATFNGDEEILILSDYASQFKMHGVTVGTCDMTKIGLLVLRDSELWPEVHHWTMDTFGSCNATVLVVIIHILTGQADEFGDDMADKFLAASDKGDRLKSLACSTSAPCPISSATAVR